MGFWIVREKEPFVEGELFAFAKKPKFDTDEQCWVPADDDDETGEGVCIEDWMLAGIAVSPGQCVQVRIAIADDNRPYLEDERTKERKEPTCQRTCPQRRSARSSDW